MVLSYSFGLPCSHDDKFNTLERIFIPQIVSLILCFVCTSSAASSHPLRALAVSSSKHRINNSASGSAEDSREIDRSTREARSSYTLRVQDTSNESLSLQEKHAAGVLSGRYVLAAASELRDELQHLMKSARWIELNRTKSLSLL